MSSRSIVLFSGDASLLSADGKNNDDCYYGNSNLSNINSSAKNSGKVCVNFVHGTCKYGKNCMYPHFTPPVCKFYLRGACAYGNRCNNSHPKDACIVNDDDIRNSVDYFDIAIPKSPTDLVEIPVHFNLESGLPVAVLQQAFYIMYNGRKPVEGVVSVDQNGNEFVCPEPPSVHQVDTVFTFDYNEFFVSSVNVHTGEQIGDITGPFTLREMDVMYPRQMSEVDTAWSMYTSHGRQGKFVGFSSAIFMNYFMGLVFNLPILPVLMEECLLF